MKETREKNSYGVKKKYKNNRTHQEKEDDGRKPVMKERRVKNKNWTNHYMKNGFDADDYESE